MMLSKPHLQTRRETEGVDIDYLSFPKFSEFDQEIKKITTAYYVKYQQLIECTIIIDPFEMLES